MWCEEAATWWLIILLIGVLCFCYLTVSEGLLVTLDQVYCWGVTVCPVASSWPVKMFTWGLWKDSTDSQMSFSNVAYLQRWQFSTRKQSFRWNSWRMNKTYPCKLRIFIPFLKCCSKIIPPRNCHFLVPYMTKPGVQTIRDEKQYRNATLSVHPEFSRHRCQVWNQTQLIASLSRLHMMTFPQSFKKQPV